MPTRKWKTEFLVNTTTFISQNQPSVAALSNGGFVIGWKDPGPTTSVTHAQIYDAAGVRSGAEHVLNISEAGNQSLPVLVGLSGADSPFWVVQQDNNNPALPLLNDITGAVYTAAGALVRSQQPSADPNANHQAPDAASLGANGAVAVWQDISANGGDIVMRGFNADGTERFVPFTVNSGASLVASQLGPAVAANPTGNRIAAVWGDLGLGNGDIRARVFDAAGAQVASEFTVNGASANTQLTPDIAWLDSGRFVVAWQSVDSVPSADTDESAVKYAIYSASGALQGAERLANSTVKGPQQAPAVAALPDGGFVIAWQDFSATGGDNSLSAIRLQAFDGVGDKRGGEILVNTTTSGDQLDVALAALADGRVVVTWVDYSETGGDTSGLAIRAQIVDPRDGIVTGTGNVETLFGHDAINDEISGFAGADTMYGLRGDDFLYGGDGADTMNGNEGEDTFFGGPGADTYAGGIGDDWFFVDDATEGVIEAVGEGTMDRVFAFISYTLTAGAEIEKFSTADHAGLAAINLTGNALADNIFGNAGPNTLDGKGGADIMTGWGGDDFYFVDNAGDVVVEAAGEGNDRVFASVSYTLPAGEEIEKLTTTDNAGTTPINLTGNELANLIFGNAGANTLDGKGGADALIGFGGDDWYYVDNALDGVTEAVGGGNDRVFAGVDYTLPAGQEIEKLTTDNNGGSAPLVLIGNEFANAIFGNAGSNALKGGAGNDSLTGLGGSDAFVFNTTLNAATNVDTISDFATDDDIILSSGIFTAIAPGTLAASAFVIGPAATTGTHRIIYNAGAVLYDPDGVGGVAAVQFATLAGAPALSNADFIIV